MTGVIHVIRAVRDSDSQTGDGGPPLDSGPRAALPVRRNEASPDQRGREGGEGGFGSSLMSAWCSLPKSVTCEAGATRLCAAPRDRALPQHADPRTAVGSRNTPLPFTTKPPGPLSRPRVEQRAPLAPNYGGPLRFRCATLSPARRRGKEGPRLNCEQTTAVWVLKDLPSYWSPERLARLRAGYEARDYGKGCTYVMCVQPFKNPSVNLELGFLWMTVLRTASGSSLNPMREHLFCQTGLNRYPFTLLALLRSDSTPAII